MIGTNFVVSNLGNSRKEDLPKMHEQAIASSVAGAGYFSNITFSVSKIIQLRQKPQETLGKSTQHITLDIIDPAGTSYLPAGTCNIYPKNDPNLVLKVITSSYTILSL